MSRLNDNGHMEKAIRSYKDLEVWKVSMSLAINIYEITKSFAAEEMDGVTLQINRVIISVSNNITEGSSRKTTKGFF